MQTIKNQKRSLSWSAGVLLRKSYIFSFVLASFNVVLPTFFVQFISVDDIHNASQQMPNGQLHSFCGFQLFLIFCIISTLLLRKTFLKIWLLKNLWQMFISTQTVKVVENNELFLWSILIGFWERHEWKNIPWKPLELFVMIISWTLDASGN